MAFIVALAFALSLAHGKRIQPITLMPRKHGGWFAPPSQQSIDTGLIIESPSIQTISDDLPVMVFDAGSNSSSPAAYTGSHDQTAVSRVLGMQHQQTSSRDYARWPGSNIASMVQVSMVSSQDSLSFIQNPPVWGVAIVAGLVLVICVGCCIARMRASRLRENRPRIQHIHRGRVVYEWDQTPQVARIYITPPEGVSENDLDIRISERQLRVGRKGKPWFLKEETYDLVNEELSNWTLSNGELQISLQKLRTAEWPQVLLHTDRPNQPSGPASHSAAGSSHSGPASRSDD